MDSSIKKLIQSGEGLSVEFKRCGNKPGKDVFETICSFANRQGGTLLLGVQDDGSIEGLSRKTAESIQRNIINVTNDKNLFNAPPMMEFELLDIDDEKVIIKVWVPVAATVYSYKGVVYDRSGDVDVKLASDVQRSAMSIRKQNYYTERTVYSWVTEDDLELDLLREIRERIRSAKANHPWLELGDTDFLKSAKLYARDPSTGERGFNLAAVMLLGKEDVISDIAPTYRTDVVLRKDDEDRYDDRMICKKNLIESYEEIVAFCEKWLPSSFVLDGDRRVDVRGTIIRELVTNCLIHREYISPIIASISIEAEGVRTRNASRPLFVGPITLENLEPTPKNPIIANFFNQMGLAEELGSGTRILYKFSNLYTGRPPELVDGDVFSAFVPTARAGASQDVTKETNAEIQGDSLSTKAQVEGAVERLLAKYGRVPASAISKEVTTVGERTVRRYLAKMVGEGRLKTEAKGRSTVYWKAED